LLVFVCGSSLWIIIMNRFFSFEQIEHKSVHIDLPPLCMLHASSWSQRVGKIKWRLFHYKKGDERNVPYWRWVMDEQLLLTIIRKKDMIETQPSCLECMRGSAFRAWQVVIIFFRPDLLGAEWRNGNRWCLLHT
jgi:hypothetical protein